MRIALYFLLLAFLVLPVVTYAQPACDDCPIKTVDDVIALIVGIVERLQIVFWITAAGSGLYAAFLFIRGGSSSESLKKAKNQILYTVIAIALGLIAFGIPRLVDSFLKIRPS